MGDSSDHNNNDDHNNSKQQQQQEQEQDQGPLCKLATIDTKPIIKLQSCDDHDDDHDGDGMKIDGGDEKEEEEEEGGGGYKTPTKKEHRIKVDLTCPPPAPMKPKTQPMKRRRPSRRTLFQVSAQDFDLIFSPPPSSSPLLNKDGDRTPSINNVNNKVNQELPNLATVLSFR